MLVARQDWLAAQDLAAASFGKSRSATETAADSARRRAFLIGVGETPHGGRSATGEPARGPARVLVLLDRPLVVALVKLTLSHCACAIRATATAAESATLLTEWQPHLAILDMDLDGRQAMQQIGVTARGTRLAIIGLTRRGDLKTKLAAFDCGADDIVTIPFAPEELLARALALLRRSYGDSVTFTPVITLGDLDIDILKRTARAGTSELHLTSLEQSLLYLLAANPGRVITREEILDTLWGVDHIAEGSVVDRQRRNLWTRLQDDWRQPRCIATDPTRAAATGSCRRSPTPAGHLRPPRRSTPPQATTERGYHAKLIPGLRPSSRPGPSILRTTGNFLEQRPSGSGAAHGRVVARVGTFTESLLPRLATSSARSIQTPRASARPSGTRASRTGRPAWRSGADSSAAGGPPPTATAR
jgi:DNA-binding response OmpR family regulator